MDTPDAIPLANPLRAAAEHLRERTPVLPREKVQAAISTAALAMWWPRIPASESNTSPGCANSRPTTSGAMNSLMMCHAVRVVSAL
jgi:hypothetical protein